MFSRAAKSVVRNLGRRNRKSAESGLKNTRASVLVADRSRVPGILTPLVEQTSEKPVLDVATTSGQNGPVGFATENGSLNQEVTEHDVINEDMALTFGGVSDVEARSMPNSCDTSLPKGLSLELPESEAGEMDMVWKLAAEGESSSTANRRLKTFPVSDFFQNLGISKQETKTCSSITESAKVLGEMGPSSHSRSCYTDFEVWLPELMEYYEILGINDIGLRGRSHHSSPTIIPRSKKIRNKRKWTPKGDGGESTSARGEAAAVHGRAEFNQQSVRNQRQRVKRRAGERVQHSKYAPMRRKTPRSYPTAGVKKLKVSKVQMRNSSKRFFQKSNTARESSMVPAILPDRKPNFLHNFDIGKKKLMPKSPIPIRTKVSAFSKPISATLSKTVAKTNHKTPHEDRVLVKTVKNPNSNHKSEKMRKLKRIRRCPGMPPVKPGGDDQVFSLDVSGSQSLEDEGKSRPESKCSSTETSCLVLCSLKDIYGNVNSIEHGSGEPKNSGEKSDSKIWKKCRSGFRKPSKGHSRYSISKKQK